MMSRSGIKPTNMLPFCRQTTGAKNTRFEYETQIQTPCGGEVEILDRGRLGEIGQFDAPLDAPFVAVGAFPVDQERQAFLEGQFGIFRIVELFLQPVPESGQAQLDEFVKQRLDEHGRCLTDSRCCRGYSHELAEASPQERGAVAGFPRPL